MHQVPAMDEGRTRNRLRPWIWGGAAGLLALPAIAMRWFPASGVDWRAGDFVVMGALLAIGLNLLLMQHYEVPRLSLWYLPVGAAALWILGQLAVLVPARHAARVPPLLATRSAA